VGHRPHSYETDIPSWDKFEPIISPEITLDPQRQAQRFILLPHERFISVLAYKTGTQIANLVPYTNGEEKTDDVVIECVCLAKYPRKLSETTVRDIVDKMDVDDEEDDDADNVSSAADVGDDIVVLAGCSDGTIREFALKCLGSVSDSTAFDCGPYKVPGPCYHPRRVIRVSKSDPIMHITVPALRAGALEDGALVYVVIRTKVSDVSKSNKKEKNINVSLFRLLVQSFDGSTDVALTTDKDGNPRKTRLDQVKCRVGKDKIGNFLNTTPFRLLSTATPVNQGPVVSGMPQHGVFLVLARSNGINVYYEQVGSSRRFSPISFPVPPSNPLTACNVSVNNTNITCGHYKGDIRVMNNVLAEVERYHVEMQKVGNHFQGDNPTSTKPEDPRSSYIASTVHWHSHPVTSMAYDPISSPMDPMLYSGGEESVLVTWQISAGKNRPVDVLPRLALGGIVHIICSSPLDSSPCNGVLVYSEDNSLQLLQSHNKAKIWKIQGIGGNTTGGPGFLSNTRIEVDPRAYDDVDAPLVITGAPDAQGYIQWYDPRRQRLSESLEVAPYNRISRMQREDNPLPTPTITKHVFSEGGKSLVTLDTTPSENVFIGAHEKKEKGADYGIVTTIRFWSLKTSQKNASSAPYELEAAMTYPHGPKNRVTGLAISNDGSMACTVSNDEKAFRLWHKVVQDSEDEAGRVPAWTCRFKVTIPAGCSNLPTSRDGVAFSDDGSTMAVCFGNNVTLWDTKEGRYLTSLRHLDCSERIIDSVQFASPGLVQDFLLIKSASGVSLQSPFGSRGSVEGWKWAVPMGIKAFSVTDVTVVESHAAVGVTVFNSTTGHSRLIFIDAASGKPGLAVDDSESIELVDGIETCLSSLCSVGKYETQSNWGNKKRISSPALKLYSLTTDGDLVCFRTDADDTPSLSSALEDPPARKGPTLDIGSGAAARKRVRRTLDALPRPEADPATKKMAVEVFGLVYADEQIKSGTPATADLPSLSSNFVRAFVGRSLSRNKAADTN
jgi:hypothetical protein